MTPIPKSLKLGLLHAGIQHGATDANRRMILDLIDQAGSWGAQIILAPEMAISGYSFDDRESIGPHVETLRGPTLTAVGKLARRHSAYICIGLALRHEPSGIFTNSAVLMDPQGLIACRYDKMTAERRWACPGDPFRDTTVLTPWGRLGILICSDTYYGLMPRVAALRGVDLLLVPANWPPVGLDPRELWRARALENGLYLAACNRTGRDRTMDCRPAASCVCDPHGELLFDGQSEAGSTFLVDLPLNSEGRLDDRARRWCMAARSPALYHDCYLNLTASYELPGPGTVDLSCVVPERGEPPVDALQRAVSQESVSDVGFWMLPAGENGDQEGILEAVRQFTRESGITVVTGSTNHQGRQFFIFQGAEAAQHWELPPRPLPGDRFPRTHLAGVHVILAALDDLAHPEMAVAAAKRGCDLALAIEPALSSDQRLLAGVRTIENLAVAACSPDAAGIWTPPEGHQRWGEMTASPGQVCRQHLDVGRLRRRIFQDRIDFDVLLGSSRGANRH